MVTGPAPPSPSGLSSRKFQISPFGPASSRATGPGALRPARAKAYGSVRQARRAMCQRRSLKVTGVPTASATSPVWIHASARRVVTRVRTGSLPTTHGTRACWSALRATSTSSAAVVRHRSRSSAHGCASRSPATAASAHSSVDVTGPPPGPAVARSIALASAGTRPAMLATASSSLCARCSTTSATVHPSQRDGLRASASPSGASSASSSRCCSARASVTSATGPAMCRL
jgi:hypothetical protein